VPTPQVAGVLIGAAIGVLRGGGAVLTIPIFVSVLGIASRR
jgi:hypothetical protein